MIRSLGSFEIRQFAKKERLSFRETICSPVKVGQTSSAGYGRGVVRPQAVLSERDGTPIVVFGLLIIFPIHVNLSEPIQAGRPPEALRPHNFFNNPHGSLQSSLSFIETCPSDQEEGEVDEDVDRGEAPCAEARSWMARARR